MEVSYDCSCCCNCDSSFLRDTSAPVWASVEIDINAPVETVWKLQTDIANWGQWNSDIEEMHIHGPVEPGTEFVWKTSGMTIHSKITDVSENRRIAWIGETIGIKAVHKWEFQGAGGVTHVYTEETFTGPLAWLLPGTMRKAIHDALWHGVSALKSISENANR
ncbi:hypothetical protein B1757_00005 [Acidithiobacillus marinus]|uniref:Polyketide cyclase n=1 Tax=Acidithiobacillus marinus TaxID=187490 RepID=A0A2I1DQU3_9PROT|nr:SRPBCC family protein [Acidithiobacillus marinus]PKY12250.1 hypothetical protein B1757_00005 [Acidithiobacillus marinus]